MKESIEMKKGVYYIIIGLCATIIMMNSIETIIKAKDIQLFEAWSLNPNLNNVGNTKEQMYSVYLTMCLSTFLIRIVTPMALSINSYFSFIKLRVNKLFVRIWIVLVIGLFIFTTLGEKMYSIFFILSSVCHLGLVVILLYLGRQIRNKENSSIYTTQQA